MLIHVRLLAALVWATWLELGVELCIITTSSQVQHAIADLRGISSDSGVGIIIWLVGDEVGFLIYEVTNLFVLVNHL